MSMLPNKMDEDAENSWSSTGRAQTGKLPHSLPQNKMDSFTLDQLYQYPACTALGLAETC